MGEEARFMLSLGDLFLGLRLRDNQFCVYHPSLGLRTNFKFQPRPFAS